MAGIYHLFAAPFVRYSTMLEKNPLIVKSLTSGVMYAAGDAIAQVGEKYHKDKDTPNAERTPLKFNVTRLGVFLVYGTLIGGPLYHYWFGYLDKLPMALYRLRQHRHRSEILRAYATLRRAGIEVSGLSWEALPTAKPFHKYTEKAMKIAADQFIFSTAYTLIFFVSVGMMTGGVEKWQADAKRTGLEEYEAQLKKRVTEAAQVEEARRQAESKGTTLGWGEKAALRSDLLKLKRLIASRQFAADAAADQIAHPLTGTDAASAAAPVSVVIPSARGDAATLDTLDRLLSLLHEEESRPELNMTWTTIWDKTWRHTQDVYLETYIADCIVWPPLQLVNFSFVPLKFQVLYVNAANLFWNSFLSFMANKGH